MKKSARITLTLVAAMGMAACSRGRRDPCEAATFNEQACNEAVRNRGYYSDGQWVPMHYSQPYPYYYDTYRRYTSSGGSVTRGGFGATGAAHASGAAGAGA